MDKPKKIFIVVDEQGPIEDKKWIFCDVFFETEECLDYVIAMHENGKNPVVIKRLIPENLNDRGKDELLRYKEWTRTTTYPGINTPCDQPWLCPYKTDWPLPQVTYGESYSSSGTNEAVQSNFCTTTTQTKK